MINWKAWSILLIASSAGIYGDSLLKIAGEIDPPNYWLCAAGMVVYASTAFGWFYILRHIQLTSIAVIYPIMQAISFILVGVFYFKEVLSGSQIIGLITGLISIFLLKRN